jgi:hypothetical protein
MRRMLLPCRAGSALVVALSLNTSATAEPIESLASASLDPKAVARALADAGLSTHVMSGPMTAASHEDRGSGLAMLTACKADFDGDGFITFEDFDAFVGAFESGLPSSDFNGDGFLTFDDFDVFVQTFELGCVLPDGGPMFPGPVVYETGQNPFAVAVGDLDGDGFLDLAVANAGSSSSYGTTVSVLRNLGNGSFAARVDYQTGYRPTSVAIGDLDGDGKPDLVAANYLGDNLPGSVSVLRNLGNGTFANAVNFRTGTNPYTVAIGDLDDDGRLDLVTANSYSSTISILRNTSSGGGNVSFAAKVDSATSAYAFSVAIGDLDGDGRSDLAVANYGLYPNYGNTVSVLRNTSSGGGNVAFAAKVEYVTGTGPLFVAIADLNGDGSRDLAVAINGTSSTAGNTVSVLSNLGNGTFVAEADYDTGSYPICVAIGDLDDDGWPDLVVPNLGDSPDYIRRVSVLRNLGDGSFSARVEYAVGLNPRSVAIADLNGDSRLDLAVANEGSNTVGILSNLGDGTFLTRVEYGAIPATYVAVGDLDGDGRPDLAGPNYDGSDTVGVLRNLGNGTFSAKADYATGAGPSSVAIGDLNGDGRPDLVVSNANSSNVSVLLNLGNGTFAAHIEYVTGDSPYSIAIGDLNGDGSPDLAVANSDSGTVSILRNLGDGTFEASAEYGTFNLPTSIAIDDLDGDGHPDLAVANAFGGTVSILRNLGDGTFEAGAEYGSFSQPTSIAIDDLDGDGHPDLAVANAFGGTVSVMRNIGDGSFEANVDYAAGPSGQSVSIGDLDGDGRPDLAVANSGSDSVSTLLNQGNGIFAAKVAYATGSSPRSVAIGDFNGDGRPDLAVASPVHGFSILLNQSGNTGP